MYEKSVAEKIKEIKDEIADTREYISSDFCTNCISMYDKIKVLEQALVELENERDRQS